MSTDQGTDELASRLDYLRATAEAVKTTPEAFDLDVVMTGYQDALSALEGVLALCRDTDGNYLNPQDEIPVGEFMAMVSHYMHT